MADEVLLCLLASTSHDYLRPFLSSYLFRLQFTSAVVYTNVIWPACIFLLFPYTAISRSATIHSTVDSSTAIPYLLSSGTIHLKLPSIKRQSIGVDPPPPFSYNRFRDKKRCITYNHRTIRLFRFPLLLWTRSQNTQEPGVASAPISTVRQPQFAYIPIASILTCE